MEVLVSNLPGEQPEILKQSILALWPMLTADRVVYPGHGGCASGADVRASNNALLEFLGLSRYTETKVLEQ